MLALPPICAMFLAKFDVHTGYELKWFQSVDNDVYNSDGLEFKAMPSGLHSVESDTICFTHSKLSSPGILYGLSVFKQNKHCRQVNKEGAVDRSKVKLYSLGILIDLHHLEKIEEFTDWKPRTYSVFWDYRMNLGNLLEEYMDFSESTEAEHCYEKFNQFFGKNSFKLQTSPIEVSQTLPKLKPAASKLSLLSGISGDVFPKDHMISSLIPMVNNFGPLIFKLWKISLLRKRVIFYSSHDPVTQAVDETNGVKKEASSVGDMSKILFCLSLLSGIPKQIEVTLQKTTKRDISRLLFHKPLYNVVLYDIQMLSEFNDNFLASTTDDIILDKKAIYDYGVKIPIIHKNPIFQLPEVTNLLTDKNEFASPKDHERYKILYSSLNNTNQECPIAHDVSEKRSFQEYIWTGLSWWASAGESFQSISEEFNIEFEFFDEFPDDYTEQIITIVGYFQQLTLKLFNGLIEIVEKSETADLTVDAHDIKQLGLDPYSASDCEFLVELVKVWWRKNLKISSYFSEACYWN